MLKRLEILRGPLGNHGYANVIIPKWGKVDSASTG